MDESENTKTIKSLEAGEQFIGFCIVRKKEKRYKSSGEPYIALELSDGSGRLSTKLWDYNNIKELKILKMRPKIETDQIDYFKLLPHSDKDINHLKNRFYNHLNSIKNEYLKELLTNIFGDKKFTENYLRTPAGKLWHHNYLYGMLEHVIAMLDFSEIINNHYSLIDLDLLKSGIFVHDIGKMQEYSLHGFIDKSDSGRLLGHINMGYSFVEKKIDHIKEFPEELRVKILHLILSHHGEKEKGSPIEAMTIEAVALHYLNELDSKTNAITRVIEDDSIPGSNWSKFVQLMDRYIYTGEKLKNDTSKIS
jgi:3'-5' exoribonuclease